MPGLSGGCSLTDREWALRTVGDPVDVVTGAVLDQCRDFVIAGRSPLRFGRWYSSRNHDLDRGLGRGFRHSLDHTLTLDLDGLRYEGPSGSTARFPVLDEDLRRAATRGYVLSRDGEEYALRLPDGTSLLFRRSARSGLRLVAVGRAPLAATLDYDTDGRLASVSDPDGNAITFLWEKGRLAGARAHPRLNGAPVDVVRYRYEGDCLVEVEDAYHHKQLYAYDAASRVVRQTDRRGYAFLYAFDPSGRCVRSAGEDGLHEVSLEYFPVECRTVVTRSDGARWEYQYTPTGAITAIVDPAGVARTFVRRAEDGQLGIEIDGAGNQLTHVYDGDGRPLGARDADGRWVRGKQLHRTPRTPLELEQGAFDPRPFSLPLPGVPLPAVAAPVAERLHSAQDATRGQVVAVRDLQGLLVREERDGRTRRYAYDGNGGLRWMIDFDGGRTDYEVASRNQRVAVRNPNGHVSRFEYTREDELAAAIDPGGSRCEYQRDAQRGVRTVARATAAKDLYVRDGAGRLVEKRDGQGRTLYTIARGPQGEVLQRTYASGGFEKLEYDADLRLVRGETAAGVVELGYAGGQRIRDERDGKGVRRTFLGDDLVEMRVLETFVTRYRYSEASDPRGAREVAITDPTGRTHRVRSVGDGIYERVFAHGVRETTQYHPSGRCLRKLVGRDGARELWERSYEYSGEGDLLWARDSARGATEYAYDAAHRLVGERRPGEAPTLFKHDDAGNLVQSGAGYATFYYGNVLAEANGRRFEHDTRQSVAQETWVGGSRRYVHDARDQLIGVEEYAAPAGTGAATQTLAWTARYDVLGRRTEKRLGDRTTAFYWDTDRLAAEVRPDGALRVYVYPDALAMTPLLFVDYDGVDAAPQSGKVYVVFANHLGCPEAVQSATGEWVWTARIAPYGWAHVEVGAEFHQPLRWPGHYFDEELGLHSNRFRTYSPELGRYLEPDPAGRGGGMENVYAYTRGNPVRWVDLRGLNECGEGSPEEGSQEEESRPDEEQIRPGGDEDAPERNGGKLGEDGLTDEQRAYYRKRIDDASSEEEARQARYDRNCTKRDNDPERFPDGHMDPEEWSKKSDVVSANSARGRANEQAALDSLGLTSNNEAGNYEEYPKEGGGNTRPDAVTDKAVVDVKSVPDGPGPDGEPRTVYNTEQLRAQQAEAQASGKDPVTVISNGNRDNVEPSGPLARDSTVLHHNPQTGEWSKWSPGANGEPGGWQTIPQDEAQSIVGTN